MAEKPTSHTSPDGGSITITIPADSPAGRRVLRLLSGEPEPVHVAVRMDGQVVADAASDGLFNGQSMRGSQW